MSAKRRASLLIAASEKLVTDYMKLGPFADDSSFFQLVTNHLKTVKSIYPQAQAQMRRDRAQLELL